MKTKLYTLILLLSPMLLSAQSELYMDTTITAEQMAMDFFDGGCVIVSNVVYTGASASKAYFEAANTDLGIPAGIYLGTGDATNAIGPNIGTGTTELMNSLGDIDLESLVMQPTYDAAVLEMDIVSLATDTLFFYYVFASEEYPEFVNSSFNDVFAFYVEGPGTPGMQNIAMVPGTSIPVSINNVNDGLNATYYVANTNGVHTEYDGLTTELPASFIVQANETYHIKLAVTDVADAAFDSGVFIGIESLCGDSLLTPPAEALFTVNGQMLEVANSSRYATSYFWDFGDGATSTERHPEPHIYNLPGMYDVTLITQNYCCSDTLTAMINIEATVGLAELVTKPFALAPNPVQSNFELQWETAKAYQITIFDAMGRSVYQNAGTGTKTFNLSHLAKGIYSLQVATEDGVYVERMVKE